MNDSIDKKFLADVVHKLNHFDWDHHSPYDSSITEESLSIIQDILRLRLPDWFVQVCKQMDDYTKIFFSIGEDFQNPSHLLARNHWAKLIGLQREAIAIADFECGTYDIIIDAKAGGKTVGDWGLTDGLSQIEDEKPWHAYYLRDYGEHD